MKHFPVKNLTEKIRAGRNMRIFLTDPNEFFKKLTLALPKPFS